jgi:hypothetical protein
MSFGANVGRIAKACSNNDAVDGTQIMFQTMILFTPSLIEQTGRLVVQDASILACIIVWLNFVVFAYFIVCSFGLQELALILKGTASTLGLAWAWTFKAYFVSRIAMWNNILPKLWTDNPAANSSDNGQYEPILEGQNLALRESPSNSFKLVQR